MNSTVLTTETYKELKSKAMLLDKIIHMLESVQDESYLIQNKRAFLLGCEADLKSMRNEI